MKKTICISICAFLLICAAACGKNGTQTERVADTRNLSAFEYTAANISATDALGRSVNPGDTENGNYVGIFYHIWHGYHTNNVGIYDITELLNTNPEALYDIYDNEYSKLGAFHYWGRPLYDYYCSDDPWVISRHIELLTMAGIDYLVYDLTNSVIYYDAINAIFERLQYFYNQGFDVPKVVFYTNTGSRSTINRLYATWYRNGRYSDLWFRFNDKPLIIGISSDLTEEEKALYLNFFDFRESQWPYGYDADYEKGFPWMDWEYPQKNYSGTVSVSLAQHPGARMSEQSMSNRGRGFDYSKFKNYSANKEKGTNYAGQWNTVFENAASVNNVFITGFNEWIAIKYEDGQSIFFVDTFNEEYSRDIEMMRGGYADNYYLQTAGYVRQYKYTAAKHYTYNMKTVDINDGAFAGWEGVTANFKDFKGDAAARNFRNADGSAMLTDSSNRNDITDVSVTHDGTNLYIKVVTAEPVTAYNGTDKNWMNVMIKTNDADPSFAGFNYVINRNPGLDGQTTVEKSSGGYSFNSAGSAMYTVNGSVMQFSIPLSSLGLTAENCRIGLKVCDNVTNCGDISDYYVTGDSAPIGRLCYTYGY